MLSNTLLGLGSMTCHSATLLKDPGRRKKDTPDLKNGCKNCVWYFQLPCM